MRPSRFNENNLIITLRAIPLDLLVSLQDWLELVLRALRAVILRHTNLHHREQHTASLIEQLQLTGAEAYRLALNDNAPLPASLPHYAAIIARRHKIPQQTVLAQSKQFHEQVKRERHIKIAALYAAGFTTRQIGQKLGISPSTVSRSLNKTKG